MENDEDAKVIIEPGGNYFRHVEHQTFFTGPVQVVMNGNSGEGTVVSEVKAIQAEQMESHVGRKNNQGIEDVRCLADMINPDCMDIYCRKFNELVLPILLHGSPSMDARTISDFVFDFTRRADESPRLKKADVYQVFSILSSYLKDCYGKEQLAMYMSVHVQGMPTKSSIVTKL